MKKNILRIILIVAIMVCGCDTPRKLIIKEIKSKRNTIIWYRESYISNTRAFVSLNFNGKDNIVLSCNDSQIIDVRLINDTLYVDAFDLTNGDIYSYKPSLNKYTVKLNPISFEDWNKFYHPELYK